MEGKAQSLKAEACAAPSQQETTLANEVFERLAISSVEN